MPKEHGCAAVKQNIGYDATLTVNGAARVRGLAATAQHVDPASISWLCRLPLARTPHRGPSSLPAGPSGFSKQHKPATFKAVWCSWLAKLFWNQGRAWIVAISDAWWSLNWSWRTSLDFGLPVREPSAFLKL